MPNKFNYHHNEKGASFFEFAAVIVVIAVIALFVVPSINNIIENFKYNAVKVEAQNILVAATLYYSEDNTSTTVTVSELVAASYLKKQGKINKDAKVVKSTSLKLQTNPIIFSGDKTIKFNGATHYGITKDKQKGIQSKLEEIIQ